jgi:hypothetical protein
MPLTGRRLSLERYGPSPTWTCRGMPWQRLKSPSSSPTCLELVEGSEQGWPTVAPSFLYCLVRRGVELLARLFPALGGTACSSPHRRSSSGTSPWCVGYGPTRQRTRSTDASSQAAGLSCRLADQRGGNPGRGCLRMVGEGCPHRGLHLVAPMPGITTRATTARATSRPVSIPPPGRS